MTTLTAAIFCEGGLFVAQCSEVDVASQGESHESARVNLVEAPLFFFEDADVDIGKRPVIEPIDIAV